MPLYRETRSGAERIVVLLAVVLAVGIGIGWLLSDTFRSDQTVEDAVWRLQDDVRPAIAALELVPLHYESTNATTKRAAGDQLDVADQVLAKHEAELRALDPERAAAVMGDLQRLDGLVQRSAPVSAVSRLATRTKTALAEAVRLQPPGQG